MAKVYVDYEKVKEQARQVLMAWGMEQDLAAVSAHHMCVADLLGIDSHGISMLPTYESKWRAGTLKIGVRPQILQQNAVMTFVDGQAGLGHPAADLAMRQAIEQARLLGVGVGVVRNSHHFGAAGAYARMALDENMVAMVTSSAIKPIMVPTGAVEPVLGTNPLAFAAPAAQGDAFVLDMATTTVAANKVRVYAYDDKTLPPGWAVDDQGQSVTDSKQATDWIFKQVLGGLTPLGGTAEMGSHKGYGLAMMVQILGATLSGSCFGAQAQPGRPDDVGHFMLVLNPAVFLGEGAFQADLSTMLSHMRHLKPADPAQPVRVAGDPEELARGTRRQQGVPFSVGLLTDLRELCERYQVPFLL